MPQQIGTDSNGLPIYGEKHNALTGDQLHNPKAPVIETFNVNPNESVLTLTGTIDNNSLVTVYWNGVKQHYPADYTLSETQVTLLMNRQFLAQITVEYYP